MMHLNFNPFPALHTERLILRQLSSNDAIEIYEQRSNERILRYLDRPATKSVEDAALYIYHMNTLIEKDEVVLWGITIKPSDIVAGTICLFKFEKDNYRAEVGYMLHPDYHRKGIMKEALAAVIKYGFSQLTLHSITANVNPDNEASIRLLKCLNFRQEAYFRENYHFNGKFLDSAIFCLVNS
jgi:[ribosomal protein S5]-alanine N-acetyltransferase